MIEIIILNFNALDKLALCLESIESSSKDYSITVIDNNSSDGSLEWLKFQAQSNRIKLVANKENVLFTKAYQDYLRTFKTLPEYFVILNNDCIVKPNWLDVMLKYMQENKRCGIVAPMLLAQDNFTIANMGGMCDFLSHKSGNIKMGYNSPEKNYWTTFACVMIRSEAFLKVNGFDEQFRFYCSDSDLCLRMNLAGYEVYNLPESQVIHFHGVSTREIGKEIQKIGHEDMVKFDAKWQRSGIKIGNQTEFLQEVKL